MSSNNNLSPLLVLPKEDSGISYQIVGDLQINEQELLNLANEIYIERESKIMNLGSEEVFIQILLIH